jgi:hypothetical protein
MVIGWIGGTSLTADMPLIILVSCPTFTLAKDGMYLDSGSLSASLPSSTSIIAARQVIGLVMEWMAKIVSGLIGVPVRTSCTPKLFR